MDWAALIPPGIVAGIGAAGVWLTAKIQHKGRPENALIDQLQEQIKDDREARDKELARQNVRIEALEVEQRKSKRRERIRDDYINKLRRHIEAGSPPPPPEWPEGLYD